LTRVLINYNYDNNTYYILFSSLLFGLGNKYNYILQIKFFDFDKKIFFLFFVYKAHLHNYQRFAKRLGNSLALKAILI
jgi:hypothetical protein